MSQESAQESSTQTVSSPPVVTPMVVHQPGTWFDEVLSGLSAQDYPNLSHVFFVTTPIVDGVADTTEANRLSSQITGTLAGAVVRVVEGNPGFGRLVNETQRIVEGQGGLFCVMHDDVALMPNTIRLLVEELFVSNAAVVAPKLSEWQSPQTLQSVGFGVDRCGEVDPFIEIGERDQEQHDAVRDVFFVSSACMLVRADLFRELGGFSPDIAFFGEDLEFCWRAHLGGARVLIAPNAVARHIRAFETRAASPVSQTI
ncbi:MAG: glycosyltransferase family 2 protein, partial [Actinomycetota bacterium]